MIRVVVATIFAVPLATCARADDAGETFFEKEVRPILVERCGKCHGDEKPKAGLSVTSRAAILSGGESGPSAVPGKPDDSALIQAIRYVDEPRMPPKGKLPDAEIATLTRWVAEGMPWPESKAEVRKDAAIGPYVITDEQRQFWSFRPVETVAPPTVKDALWPKSDIDRFLLARLESAQLRPAPAADKRTLLRRASFDLTGLPPTPAEIDDFLADTRPDAFARVIDRLLASPAYGERWARHWLDVVRYADSLDSRGSGQPGEILDAYKYRDWVVKALNDDLPYDRFVRDQIAGDLIEKGPSYRDGVVATTMLAIGNWGNGDADKEKILVDIADDQVDVVSKAFLGLTVSCARCHDHKFDPIPTKDYYGLAGIFLSTHILPSLTPKGAGESIIRVPLDSPEDVERRKTYQSSLGALDGELKAIQAREYAALAATLRPETARYLLALRDYRNRPADQAGRTLEAYAADRGLIPFAIRQWADAMGAGEGTLLASKIPAIAAIPGVQAWTGSGTAASATANQTDKAQAVATFRLPPRSISVHPGPSSGVGVTWTSPMTGRVRVSGRVADSDPAGGDGVLWYLDHRSASGGRELASGGVPNGEAMSMAQGRGADALASVEVREGDSLRLSILPNAEYTCDTTTIELTILPWNDSPAWDLTRDVLDDFLSANPHPDRRGHAATWRFDDLGTKDRPAQFSGGPDSPWSAWASALAGGDEAKIADAASGMASAFATDDPRSPFRIREARDEVALAPEARSRIAEARDRLERLRSQAPPPVEFANAAQDGGVPESSQRGVHDTRVHVRGRYDRLGDPVPRHFPVILGGDPAPKIEGSGRRELAEWIARPENPLTARVIVNRLWQHHFGEGIVRTPSNFGKLGDRPSHPELLDYLANRLVAHRWSLKAMHREIMLTAAYAQASIASPESVSADPENRLIGRMSRRRLEAEILRDNLLSVSGRLDARMGGPAERDFSTPRRGLYMITIRSDRATFGSLFDQADSTASIDRRVVSTVAPQSLFLLNNPFVLAQAKALSDRLRREVPEGDADRIARAYALLFARVPTDAERAVASRVIERAKARGESVSQAWDTLSHIWLCANEFVYID